MILRGIEFGPAWCASGTQGFFGEGYWYHRVFRALLMGQFSFEGATFVAKTATLAFRAGNMPFKTDGLTPREWKPRCIHLAFPAWLRGAMLNAVGLSGPGARFLFQAGRWQERREPFFISFMAVKPTRGERRRELNEFMNLFDSYRPWFRGPHGLQINLSCSNVGLHHEAVVKEALEMLDDAKILGIPLVPKVNVLFPVEAAAEIAAHRHCDAICVSNAIPWGSLPDRINWRGLFGSDVSPLARFGGGALSGAPLLPLVIEWLARAKSIDFPKPVNAGGGILHPAHVTQLKAAGASSISLGSIVLLRPWQLRRVVLRAEAEFRATEQERSNPLEFAHHPHTG